MLVSTITNLSDYILWKSYKTKYGLDINKFVEMLSILHNFLVFTSHLEKNSNFFVEKVV